MGRHKGFHHSEETKQKLKQVHIGKPKSPEWREKLREAAKRRGITKEWRQHMVDGLRRWAMNHKSATQVLTESTSLV